MNNCPGFLRRDQDKLCRGWRRPEEDVATVDMHSFIPPCVRWYAGVGGGGEDCSSDSVYSDPGILDVL